MKTEKQVLEMMGRVAIADGLLTHEEETLIRDYASSVGIDCEDYIAQLHIEAEAMDSNVIAVHTNVLKGIEFENYIFDCLANSRNIKVESRSTDFKLGKGSSLDQRSLDPDFMISQAIGRFRIGYWVECKYRSKPGTLSFTYAQIERYRSAEQRTEQPVFILYGEGGRPTAPEKVYLFHLSDIINKVVAGMTANGNYSVKPNRLNTYIIDVMNFENIIRNFMNL
ncbi:MAG: TerB family tellurite resistance protein [Staphylococcus sp.]|nr:TerB family tellurite resistance protein [Staphylococcus sp.]